MSSTDKQGPKVLVTTFVSTRLSGAACRLAILATEAESSKPLGFQTNEPERDVTVLRVMEYAASAVVMSVAALEGFMNEVFAGADDEHARLTRRIQRSTAANVAEKRWARLWARGVPGRGFNALEKVQILLDLADLDELPTNSGSLQQLAALIQLRNQLVHSQPRTDRHAPFDPVCERGKFEKLLMGSFEASSLLPVTVPFIWSRCLSAGCAKWAVETKISVENDVRTSLGISIVASAPWKAN